MSRLKPYAYIGWQGVAFTHEIAGFFGLPLSHTYRTIKGLLDIGAIRKVGTREEGEPGRVAAEKTSAVKASAVRSRRPIFYTVDIDDSLVLDTLDDRAREYLGGETLESIKKHRWWEEKKEENDETR